MIIEEEVVKWEAENGIVEDPFDLENFLRTIGYKESPLGNSEILEFLKDNPEAVRCLISWISTNGKEKWKNEIMSELSYLEKIKLDEDYDIDIA